MGECQSHGAGDGNCLYRCVSVVEADQCYEMGEAYAANMGLNVKSFRVLLVLLSSVLAACVTAFAGPVSFVGIAVPHLVKWLLGTRGLFC